MNHEDIKLLFGKLSAFDELYLVGGSVRDLILGKPIKDYDFTVPFTPTQIKEKLKKCGIKKTFDVGEKFGTIGCVINELDVEITTFRGEQYNYINRKPEVSYIQNIEEDVVKRDFTINSLYCGRDDYLILIGEKAPKEISSWCSDDHRKSGTSDVLEGVIKTVGNPGKRFNEDPLRMLRAIRFAGQLDFKIEEKTFEMIQRLRVKLLNISVERWMQELDKILSFEKPPLKLLGDSCLLDIMIPELSYQIRFNQNSKYHNFDLWEHTVNVVTDTPLNDLNLRWAALLHDIGKPFVKTENKKGHSNYMGHEIMSAYLVKQIGLRLKWPNERIKKVSEIIEHHLNDYCILRQYDQKNKIIE